MKRTIAVLAALQAFSSLAAALTVGRPFADGAVLQRDRPVPVWGTAAPGAEVKVSFGGQEKSAVAGTNGEWCVTLDPMPASSEGRNLTITSQTSRTSRTSQTSLSDLLVGEVWLCSGQSNMEMSFAYGRTRYGDGIGAMVAQVTDKPLVRYMKSPGNGGWNRLTPKFLTSGWRSAIPVHYALELHDKLGIPVGVIVAAVGGSNIDSWNPVNGTNANLHASRIVPLGPYALRGALWYQGETNVKEVEAYPVKLGQLHAAWKEQFRDPSLPLYLVQLAPYRYAKPEQLEALPAFMENQAKYAAEHPDAAVTVVNDIGNFEDIHPNNKWLVAKRLALHAFKREYGFKNVEDDSPVLESATIAATNRVRLVFNHAKSLYVYRTDSRFGLFAEFELAGEDGVWKKADIVNFPNLDWTKHGVLTNNVIELVAKEVEKPVRVRHAYVAPFTGVLYNQVNLPCGPFCAEVRQ